MAQTRQGWVSLAKEAAMSPDAWFLIALAVAYVLASVGRYLVTRRRHTTLGDTLLSNLVKHKIQKTVS